jgi:ubiquinone/menaquinone biosynthesis C-methylase UbiE
MEYIDLTNLSLTGRVLDVGGGGEGIISRRVGSSVVAIDLRAEELAETPDIGVKIIMDACDLKFIDGYFDAVTCFYSLMYMSAEQIERFAKEAYRVMKQGTCLYIWDAVIPPEMNGKTFITEVKVKINPAEEISTGYGIGGAKEQTAELIQSLFENAGFKYKTGSGSSQAFEAAFIK